MRGGVADLDADAPDLVALLRRADPMRRRMLSRSAVAAALDAAVVNDPRIGAARAALDQGRYGVSSEARDLERLVGELDELAWAQQARGAEREYRRCFERARAAASLLAALQADSGQAAYDAAYEALAALEDVPALRRALFVDPL